MISANESLQRMPAVSHRENSEENRKLTLPCSLFTRIIRLSLTPDPAT